LYAFHPLNSGVTGLKFTKCYYTM